MLGKCRGNNRAIAKKIETQVNLVDETKVLTSIIKGIFILQLYINRSSWAAWITICLVFPSPPKLRQPIWVAPGSHWLHSPAAQATSLPFIRKSFHWLSLENNIKTIQRRERWSLQFQPSPKRYEKYFHNRKDYTSSSQKEKIAKDHPLCIEQDACFDTRLDCRAESVYSRQYGLASLFLPKKGAISPSEVHRANLGQSTAGSV